MVRDCENYTVFAADLPPGTTKHLKLKVFFKDGRRRIDVTFAEAKVRPGKVGRRLFLHLRPRLTYYPGIVVQTHWVRRRTEIRSHSGRVRIPLDTQEFNTS